MIPTSPLLPEQASDVARSVDHLMLFALSGLVYLPTSAVTPLIVTLLR